MEPNDEDDDVPAEELPRGAPLTTLSVPTADGGAQALVPPLRLRVLDGAAAGALFSARRDRVVVGTHASADLVLADPTVSRFHCELVVAGGRVVVRDLGSRNGTCVGGVSVIEAHVAPGAELTVGRTRLRFELGAEPVAVALSAGERFGSLVGRALSMRAVFATLARAAASDATLLVSGETGTGKEGVAEAVHGASARAGGPLVVVDCGAIPANLLESELFGHERGAFTGAVAARAGAFEAASGGTIFLDEIGELDLELQPKLLRVLERREVRRIGRNQPQPIDVRVVAATNRDLREEVNARRFRSDLYYRLAVVEVRLPPLRERVEDLPLLVDHLLGELGAAGRSEAEALRTPAARAELARHPWPGNVRELRNYLERCLVLAERVPPAPASAATTADGAASSAAAPAGVGADRPLRDARETWSREFERRYLEELLARHDGNVSQAARGAGVDRKYLYRLLWRHGLR
jgi:two-component system, NtrC family, response regulator GlrR